MRRLLVLAGYTLCAVATLALYASGAAPLSAPVITLMLVAWAGGVLFAVLLTEVRPDAPPNDPSPGASAPRA